MITNLKFNNCFAFNKQVNLSLNADMRTKKFTCNIINIDKNINILKAIAIYGPNNTGKTAVMNCMRAIKGTLLNQKVFLQKNIFEESDICELGIEFIDNSNKYYYEYKYNSKTREYLYEMFEQIIIDKYGNEKRELILQKDTINKEYKCVADKKLELLLSTASKNNIIIYLIEIESSDILKNMKNILTKLAEKVEIVDMNDIPNQKTISFLKNKNNITDKTVELIKNADLYLENYYYDNSINEKIDEIDAEIAEEKILKKQNLIDQIKLVSVYKGKTVHSVIFDSVGTKKFAALASYIIEALDEGKILFIDELDSSLHFKITRAIISMFNNEINKNAQLIATLHDISLLDCKKMFRKEQIWFTAKDERETYLYSLKNFNYAEDGIRDTTDVRERYSKGVFGAIPDPELISALLEVNDGDS